VPAIYTVTKIGQISEWIQKGKFKISTSCGEIIHHFLELKENFPSGGFALTCGWKCAHFCTDRNAKGKFF
jgi:hypothetical protein